MDLAQDTIFALASGRGRAGIAVIRISGPGADAALASLGGGQPAPRVASLATLTHPESGGILDQALVIRFPGPASFTGEDVVEMHVHGGAAVIAAVSGALGALPGLRPAEAGEFTRRAFAGGKLDLSRVEGLADLVAAETEAQRRQALSQFGGALSARFDAWRAGLIAVLAEVECAVDFSDEDLPEELLSAVLPKIKGITDELNLYMEDDRMGERLRDGFRIAIVGAPNVGKSSLLNALVRRDAAIVSETAGTTRDVIEVHLDLAGIPVVLADTAGLREATDPIEVEGTQRAVARAENADLRLAVFDARTWPEGDVRTKGYLGPGTIAVVNKIDLIGAEKLNEINDISQAQGKFPLFFISVRTGAGIGPLLTAIAAGLSDRLERLGPAPMTRERHRRAAGDALAALNRALALPTPAAVPELLAEELRLAARALGRIAGYVDVEDVLDRIFSQFCIGK